MRAGQMAPPVLIKTEQEQSQDRCSTTGGRVLSTYDPFNRSRNYRDARSGGGRNRGYSGPTLEDFQSLLKAYNELVAGYQKQEQRLAEQTERMKHVEAQSARQTQQIERQTEQIERQREQIEQQDRQLKIKNDAIERQTEDVKRLDSELMWTKAALDQAENRIAELESDEHGDSSWQERYARLQAELNNVRKRWEQRAANRIDEERNRLLLDMLPLADHLELALRHANGTESDGSEPIAADEQFIANIRATLDAFLNTLKRYNVEPIDANGAEFDPNVHEAVGRVASEAPADHVAEVVQTGYVSGDKLLRPARVLVSGG
jgi:molecular chaperone GrpE